MNWDWSSAIMAFFVTVSIFLIGFLVSEEYNAYKVSSIKDDYRGLFEDMESLQLEEMYLEQKNSSSCSLREYQLEQLSGRLNDVMKRLVAYQNAREFSSEFFNLKRDYTLLQLRAWILTRSIQKECDLDVISVLYFFDLTTCPSCEEQGYVLDFYRREVGHKLMVFSVDRELSLPIMGMITTDYNVSSAPVLIINGKKHDGLVNKDQMKEILCEEYSEKPGFC